MMQLEPKKLNKALNYARGLFSIIGTPGTCKVYFRIPYFNGNKWNQAENENQTQNGYFTKVLLC